MIPTIGNVDIAIAWSILTEPAIIILLLISGCAGLLRGKMEDNQARLGIPEYKGMENLDSKDWGEDFGLGVVGGLIGMTIIFSANNILSSIFDMDLAIFFMPVFGYAGRKILMGWGKKVESTLPQ